jgi:Uma2 family endonuclease
MSIGIHQTHDFGRFPSAPVHRFTVDEYHRMIQAGVLTENQRVELLEGWIVAKMPHNPPHDSTIDLVVGQLEKIMPQDWFIRIQSAITTEDSEPEPDIAVVRGPRGRYLESHPRAPDIGLLIEVSDASLDHDRNDKAPLYARARIGAYWIVNLVESRIEVYREPSGPDSSPCYHDLRFYGRGDSIPIVLEDKEIGRIEVMKVIPERNTR